MFGIGTCDSFVGIDLDKLPIVTTLDVVGVIIDLRLVAGILLFAVCRDASITSCAALSIFVNWRRREPADCRRYSRYGFGY